MYLRLVGILLVCVIGLFDVDARFECDKQSVPCGCGLNSVGINTRFDYGEDAVPYSWSMIVSVRYDCHRKSDVPTHCCGGTILSESYVLTSARCVERIDSSMLQSGNVTIAADARSRPQQHRASRTVDQIFIHPNWMRVSTGSVNDIAILHLADPLDFNTDALFTRTCRPPRMNSSTDFMQYPTSASLLTVVGWSQSGTANSFVSKMLRQATVYSVQHNDSTCSGLIKDPKLQFCAGLRNDGQGPCNSDSGSPILRWIGDRWEQVGIVSHGLFGCPSDGYQNVFTKIAPYYDWIELIMHLKHPSMRMAIRNIPLNSVVLEKPRVLYRCDRKSLSCGCGNSQVELTSSRIFGGEEAIRDSWSLIVSVRLNGSAQHACGGSILNDYFIVTAANCVANAPKTSPTGVAVRVDFHQLSEGAQVIIEIDQIFLHPKYIGISDGYQNDIAILHLSETLALENNSFLKRTCVPYLSATMDMLQYPPNGTDLAAIGWGMTQQGMNNMSDALQQAGVVVIDNNDPKCKASIKDKETQFCAGLYNGGKDTCQGDSGGPILEWKGKWWEQVGITSFRKDCGMGNQPVIYTRLAPYVDWLEKMINGSLTTTTKRPPITNPPLTYTCDKSVSCGCGYNNVILPPSRIVGGYDAVPYSWPMVVSLRNIKTDRFFCGGSILSDSFILTAAHCVMNRQVPGPNGLIISAGHNKQSHSSQVLREVDRVHIHPEWVPNQSGNWNDIAILHLSQPLNISTNPFLSRTCVPQPNETLNMLNYPLNGTRVAVIGWGAIEDGYQYSPDDLQQVKIFVMHKQDQRCDKTIKDKARQFCAGLYEGGKDSCRGDSGGPVLEWKGNRWEQVGIVSYGIECANPNVPGVFTQVVNYVDWIEKVINGSLAITIKPPLTSSPRPTGLPTTTGSMGASKYENNAPILALFLCLIWGHNFKASL